MSRLCSNVWVPTTMSPARAVRIAAQASLDCPVEQEAVLAGEPAVMQRRHALDLEQQAEPARRGQRVARALEQRHGIGDGVAHDEHLGARLCGPDEFRDQHIRLADARPRLDRNGLGRTGAGDFDGWVTIAREGRIGNAQRLREGRTTIAGTALQRLPSGGAERRRHEKREPTGPEVGVEKGAQYRGHVGVAGVHLVDDEQMSEERAGPQMRVGYL